LNRYLKVPWFKIEMTSQVTTAIQPGDWAASMATVITNSLGFCFPLKDTNDRIYDICCDLSFQDESALLRQMNNRALRAAKRNAQAEKRRQEVERKRREREEQIRREHEEHERQEQLRQELEEERRRKEEQRR
jgi:hypothetical protein